MPRQIVRIITPGTVGEEMVLTAAEKSFLVSVARSEKSFALAALDVSTGEFIATETLTAASLHEEIARLSPREIIARAQRRRSCDWDRRDCRGPRMRR